MLTNRMVAVLFAIWSAVAAALVSVGVLKDLASRPKNQNQKETKMTTKRTLKNAAELFPSAFIKVADIEAAGGEVTLRIAGLDLETFEDPKTKEKEEKPILLFSDAEKSLILNKTNARVLTARFGNDLESWTGKEITLIVATVESFGEMVPAIRVK